MKTYNALLVQKMAGPIVEGLKEQRQEPESDASELRLRFRRKLHELDWSNFAQVGVISHVAYNDADNLAGHALYEARRLMRIGAEFVAENPREGSGDVNRILKASRAAFKKDAELPDDEQAASSRKVDFFAVVVNYPNPHRLEHMFQRPIDSPLRYDETAPDQLALAWHPAIDDWLGANRAESGGCPALRYRVDHLIGKKAFLVDYFWDRIADIEYPEI